MPRSKKEFIEIHDQRKRHIMHTAMELFANDGYYTTSVAKIARRAKISKGLMYHYFESKEALVSAILDQGMEAMMTNIDQNNDGVLTRDEIETLIRSIFQQVTSNITYWKLYFSFVLQPAIHQIVTYRHKRTIDEQSKLLTDYFNKMGNPDAKIEALVFHSLIDGIAINYAIDPENFPLEDCINYLIKKYVNS